MVIKRNMRRGKLSEIAGTAVLSKEDWAATKKEIAKAESLSRKRMSEMSEAR